MDPQQLFDYADRYARKRENAGRGTVNPTMTQAAHRFGVTLDEIYDTAKDYQGDGYMGIVVAIGIAGVGASCITPRGAWLVEAYK